MTKETFNELYLNKGVVSKWTDKYISGSKRTNLRLSSGFHDWFVGYGKDKSCQFEGTWWDMICFARNILASDNTKIAAPEFHKPEWANDNYLGENIPYEVEKT